MVIRDPETPEEPCWCSSRYRVLLLSVVQTGGASAAGEQGAKALP